LILLAELKRFETDVLVACEVPAPDAAAAADALVYADARRLTTHGLALLVSTYAHRLRDGTIAAASTCCVAERAAATAILDGRDGLGPVVATRALDLALELASRAGVGAVGVRNSSHFGAAGYYAHRASERGFVAIAATNCGTQGVVPPLGGSTRLLGTNPLSVAAPARTVPPFVLDMSSTVAATGRIKAAARAGEPVPDGWLRKPGGGATTDPQEYVAGDAEVAWLGGELATGGAKGYGLAVAVDLLCGALTGSGFGPRAAALADPAERADDRRVGHFFVAFDPAVWSAGYADDADELLTSLVSSPACDGDAPVAYAGLPEDRRARRAEAEGVELPPAVLAAAEQLARELSVAPLAEGAVTC
jgi:LDH2 family malate/lactate/ureidoglycolate dehydrogenase